MDQVLSKRLLAILLPIFLLWLAAKALGSALVVLVLAFICGFLLLPLFRKLDAWRLPRALSAIVLFILLMSFVSMIIILVLPSLVDQTKQLVTAFPSFLASALDRVSQWLISFGIGAPESAQEWVNYLKAHAAEILQATAKPFLESITQVVSGTASLLNLAMNLILFPVFFFFLILDFETTVQRLKSVIPASQTSRFESYFKSIEDIFSGFFRGQILVCLALGALYGMGFWFVNVPYGVLIGVVGGLLSFIPYLGATFCLITSLVLALALGPSWSMVVGVLIVFAVAQTLESFVLTPKLVGDKVGLGPLATILALIAGGNLAGFAGLLIAIPAGGLLKLIAKDLLQEIHASLKP